MTKKPEEAIGPEIGSNAPNTNLRDDTGNALKLHDRMGENGLAISFVRSLGWCPFCKKQIRQLDEVRDALTAVGWNVVSVTYDSPEVLRTFREKTGISLGLLSDEGSVAIDAFNLRNKGVKPGGKSVGVPHPAVVFVGSDGMVKEMLRHKGYQTRPSAEDVVNAAKVLAG